MAQTGTRTLTGAQAFLSPASGCVSPFVGDREQGLRGGGRNSSCESLFPFELKILISIFPSFFPVLPDFLLCFSVTEL